MEQTLNNERVEYTKTIENLNNTNKEKMNGTIVI